MANWFYIDANGTKQGPVNDKQLVTLAAKGVITQETVIENEQGKSAPAGRVKGLTFAETKQPEIVSPVETEVYGSSFPAPMAATTPGSFCTYCGQPVHPMAAACMACGANPRDHRKFCRSCGVTMNEAQVICTKCHTPVGGNTGLGSVAVGQMPAVPVQSVAQGQPYASAQLVIDRLSSFTYSGNSFDVLINGQKVGELTNGQSVEISAPTGSVKLEIRSQMVRVIAPVMINLAVGQKKKIALRQKDFYVLRSILAVILSLIFGLVMVACFEIDPRADPMTFTFVAGLFGLPPILIYQLTLPAYVIKEEV